MTRPLCKRALGIYPLIVVIAAIALIWLDGGSVVLIAVAVIVGAAAAVLHIFARAKTPEED